MTFTDYSSAFNKLNRSKMFFLLIRKIPPLIWLAIFNYYFTLNICYKNANEENERFIRAGVKQGGKDSPLMFGYYDDPLLAELTNSDLLVE